ncbi:MAG TPA: LTA synthase family protein [Saprospiraceae bacterium]|nr:LTA synthase family protein [Saprospiraceae bacterium]
MLKQIQRSTKLIRSSTPSFLISLLSLYLTGMLVFCLFRIILLAYTADDSISFAHELTLQSLLIGLNYDSVTLCYILALPLILLYFQSLVASGKRFLAIGVSVMVCTMYPVLMFLSISDIPYYKFFKNRLSDSSMQWLGQADIIVKMAWGSADTALLLVLGLLLPVLVGYYLMRYCKSEFIQKSNHHDPRWRTRLVCTATFMGLAFLCFLGMRGGRLDRPIRPRDAVFCNNNVLNQIALNPAYNLLTSYLTRIDLVDEDTAILNTQKLLSIDHPIGSISPIAREIRDSSGLIKPNIVLVLMEGLSARFMGAYGDTQQLTPNLDSLSRHSWFFRNAYSTGIHTNHGVFSTLYGFPAVKRPLLNSPIRQFSGMPKVLHDLGYRNLFFCTHTEVFDNFGAFLPANGFDELYSLEDYPEDQIVGPWGVPDDYLFSRSLERLRQLDSSQPFFATILTNSNHKPYVLPAHFQSDIKNPELKAVKYSDWAIGEFLKQIKHQSWYDRTLFVFMADHGRVVGKNPFAMALSYNHIPLILFAPDLLGEPKDFDHFIGQVDLFPTLMGIMNASYINNTLGIDVLQHPRPCIYFSADDKIGCLDEKWLYIYHLSGTEGLYDHTLGSTENAAMQHPEALEKLKHYAFSQLQAYEWMVTQDKTRIPELQ